jgi:hypothetical protein
MTPAKRQPATPASQGPKSGRVPDVPTSPPKAPVQGERATVPAPPAATKDGILLGPEGEPIAQKAPRRDAGGDSAPSTQIGQVDAEDRATTQSPRRPLSLYPLPVWPD